LVGALLAHTLLSLGALDDAATITAEVEEQADPDDPETQVLLRCVQARLSVSDERAREAADLAATTDAPGLQALALSTLGAVLADLGDESEARAALGRALALYERKGNVAAAAQLVSASDTAGAAS